MISLDIKDHEQKLDVVQDPPEDRISILIGSTDSYTSYTLKELLKPYTDIQVLGDVRGCIKLIEVNRQLQPQINILDIGNNIFYGWLDIVKQIRDVNPGTKIVLLSDLEENISNFIEGIKVGVTGYLLSTAPVHQIIPAIRAVQAGITVVDPNLAFFVASRFIHNANRNRQHIGKDGLTNKETEIIGLAAKGFTNRDIATTLKISENTVKAHLADVYGKLGVSNRTQAIMICMSNGVASPSRQHLPVQSPDVSG